jgi:hypothetical protein
MPKLYLAVPLLLASLAAVWTFWPEKYVAWLHAMTQKMPSAMRIGAEGVSDAFPFPTSKSWYSKFLRVMGLLLWLLLLMLACMFFYAYRSPN